MKWFYVKVSCMVIAVMFTCYFLLVVIKLRVMVRARTDAIGMMQ